MSMARSADSLNRPKSRYKPQPTLLVICEDSKSGERYLKDASYHFRVDVKVEITHCGNTDPIGIVNEAMARQGKFDQVFCVIDRDNHPSFDEALVKAKTSKKVGVIASYPCFEFWLLLHFVHTRKPYTSVGNASAGDRLIRELRTHPGMESYAKGDEQSVFDLLLGEKFNFARREAPKILSEALAGGEMNPSTAVHELIDLFENLSKPQLI